MKLKPPGSATAIKMMMIISSRMNYFNISVDEERTFRDRSHHHETLGWYFHVRGLPEEPREAKGPHVQHRFPGLSHLRPGSAGSLCWINNDNWIPSTLLLRCRDRHKVLAAQESWGVSSDGGEHVCSMCSADGNLSEIWLEISENTWLKLWGILRPTAVMLGMMVLLFSFSTCSSSSRPRSHSPNPHGDSRGLPANGAGSRYRTLCYWLEDSFVYLQFGEQVQKSGAQEDKESCVGERWGSSRVWCIFMLKKRKPW